MAIKAFEGTGEYIMIKDVKAEIGKLNIDGKTIRNFGILFFILSTIASAYTYWKGHEFWFLILAAGVIFLCACLIFPNSLKGLYKAWMTMAFFLGWFMTRIILTVFFFAILTPFALILRISGKDLLNRKIDKNAKTYWIRHEQVVDRNQYKKQF
jgi:hypothetical protein